jgi:hypothetical protein
MVYGLIHEVSFYVADLMLLIYESMCTGAINKVISI